MTSETTPKFWKYYDKLPQSIQEVAKKAYQICQKDPYNPSLKFKQIHSIKPIYSVRIGLNYRAVGIKDGDTVIWFWIGSNSESDEVIAQF